MATKKNIEEMTNEESKMTIAEVEEKIKKMLEEAEEKARNIAMGIKTESFTENEKKVIARGEEYIEVQLFKDNDKYKDDVYVAVGNQNCVIKRGVPVRVKRKFFDVLTQSNEQDLKTAQLIEGKSQKASEN